MAILSATVLLVSCTVVGRNVWLRRGLAREMASYHQRLLSCVGSRVPSFWAYDLRGHRVRIPEPMGDQLILVFSPSCQACADNWPAWDRVAAVASKAGVQVIYLNLTRELPLVFAIRHPMLLIYSEPDPRVVVDLKLVLTPETLVVDRSRTIVGAWIGTLTRDDETHLLAMLPPSDASVQE